MQVNQEDRVSPPAPSTSNNKNALIIVAIVVVAAVAGYVYVSSEPAPEPVTPAPIPVQMPEPVPEHPIERPAVEQPVVVEPIDEVVPLGKPETPEVIEPEPLPALTESDEFIEQQTLDAAQGVNIAPLLIEKDIARQFVVFIDNLAQGELIRKASVLKGPEDDFVVSEITNKTFLNPDSYHRYDRYAALATELSSERLVDTFNTIAPLLDEAFEELGYGESSSFKQRLQQAFSVILDAPVIEDPIELSTISVNYQFVDPQLEALPDAQKLLIRMGPENTQKIKQAVRKLRQQLN